MTWYSYTVHCASSMCHWMPRRRSIISNRFMRLETWHHIFMTSRHNPYPPCTVHPAFASSPLRLWSIMTSTIRNEGSELTHVNCKYITPPNPNVMVLQPLTSQLHDFRHMTWSSCTLHRTPCMCPSTFKNVWRHGPRHSTFLRLSRIMAWFSFRFYDVRHMTSRNPSIFASGWREDLTTQFDDKLASGYDVMTWSLCTVHPASPEHYYVIYTWLLICIHFRVRRGWMYWVHSYRVTGASWWRSFYTVPWRATIYDIMRC